MNPHSSLLGQLAEHLEDCQQIYDEFPMRVGDPIGVNGSALPTTLCAEMQGSLLKHAALVALCISSLALDARRECVKMLNRPKIAPETR